jgi:glycosyltransferase 2 family protein
MNASLKKKLFLFLRLFISFGLIGYIFWRLAGEHELGDLFSYWADMSWGWVAGAFLITFSLLAIGSVRWGMLLTARGVKLSPISYFMYYMVGMFFNNFLPSTVGGDVVKAYYLSRATGKTAVAFISVLLDRLMGMGGLCLVAIAACLLGGRTLWSLPATRPYALPVFLIVGGLSLSLGLFFLVSFNDRVMNFFLSLSRWGKIGEKIRELHQALYLYKGQAGVLVRTLLISTGIWVLIVIGAWMVSLAFVSSQSPLPPGKTPPISILYFFLFMPPISVIMSLPISFAGIGTREMGFIIFFGALQGIGELDALVISLTFYCLYLTASLIGGVIYIFKDSLRFHREVPDLDLAEASLALTTEEELPL